MPETPVWRIDLERGRRPSLSDEAPELYDSASFPSSPDSEERRSSLHFLDQRNNLYRADPDRRNDWKVSLAKGQDWVTESRKDIITGIKVVANAIVLGGAAAETYGISGRAAKATGGVMNTGTQAWDVWNNASSAYQTYQEDGLTRGVFQDAARATAQGVAFGAGMVNAFAPYVGPTAGLVQNATTIAALATTGPTSQEAKKAREKDRRTFTHHRNDHIAEARPAPERSRPRDGGQGRSTRDEVTFGSVSYTEQSRRRPQRHDTERIAPESRGSRSTAHRSSPGSSSSRDTPTSTARNAQTAYYAAQGQGQGSRSREEASTSGMQGARQPLRRQGTRNTNSSSGSSSPRR
ncbi:hypothetical protein ACIQNU_25075 [Streptomyces sp. NPDC091292]|uniref:hypothetical protein n=1 Tax=Streptomyces sp. NPDC091292 TaxID=3365991 RepID=UPI00382FBD76